LADSIAEKLTPALFRPKLKNGTPFALGDARSQTKSRVREVGMSNDSMDRHITHRTKPEGRRHQLRELLLAAADAARASRQLRVIADCTRPVGQAVRERVSMLVSATN
jgi:hypothetical protein